MANPEGVKSVGIIMDGNRRWAKSRGVPTLEGHRQGLEKAKELLEWAQSAGVREIVLYAFSTENWNRAADEVSYLMGLFENALDQFVKNAAEKGVRLRFIGQWDRASESLQKKMYEAEALTRAGTQLTLALAFSYGGRAEILAAVNKFLTTGAKTADEQSLRECMWSHDLADPDLIIRTGGERRLSGFLTWQSVYSELFFSDSFWPDFSKEEFDAILAEFATRERRNGK